LNLFLKCINDFLLLPMERFPLNHWKYKWTSITWTPVDYKWKKDYPCTKVWLFVIIYCLKFWEKHFVFKNFHVYYIKIINKNSLIRDTFFISKSIPRHGDKYPLPKKKGQHAKCNFHPHSVILHAECEFPTQRCNFWHSQGDYDTLECDLCTQSVISTRSV
jgi:hypothetical protein